MKLNQRFSNVNLKTILDPNKVRKLLHAKSEYGQLLLFNCDKQITVFRPLTISESEILSQMFNMLHPVAIEDWVFGTCFVTGSKELDYFLHECQFSYVSKISKALIEKSNIQDEKEYKKALLKYRDKTSTLQNVVEVLISKGYRSYTHDQIKNLTQIKQFELLGNSELITGEKLDLGDKKANKARLREFVPGATVIGGEDITSKEVADIPDFNENF